MISIPALYLHIPFCRKVCPFCSFAVLKNNPSRHKPYLNLLRDEYDLLQKQISFDFSNVESIYLGGGTPSSLNAENILYLLEWVGSFTPSTGEVHRSIEINPDDASLCYFQALKEAGITRISLGVQSFDNENLSRLQREHTREDSLSALDKINHFGFDDLNIDLMFGYPGQSVESLLLDLDQALKYAPRHISVYSLTIEPKTRWFRNPCWAAWINANDKEIAEMYRMISTYLTAAGFIHYEISNFCLPGYQSRQNIAYWHNRNWLGLGLGAHSHIHPRRWGNSKRMVDYKNALEKRQRPLQFIETMNSEQQRDEDLMLAMRLKKGLSLKAFTDKHKIKFPEVWKQKVDTLMKNGLFEENTSRLIPTINGFLLSDEISSSLAACLK